MSYRVIRDAVTTTVALGVLIYEVAFGAAPRPEVLMLIGAMLAVPAFLQVNEKLRDGKDKDE